MAVSQNGVAPYATLATILDILERFRKRGLPKPINKHVLSRSGVSDSLIPRTLQSLQILDLIDKDGNPTDTFEGFRLAPEPEYKKCLAEWLKGAYDDVFSFVDPSTDDETAIRDAFRSYTPIGQQDRMVLLFIGLCVAAELREGAAKEPKTRTTKKVANNPPSQRKSKKSPKGVPEIGSIPAALVGLLQSLPPEGGSWSREQRDKFTKIFETVLDFCFPIKDHENSGTDND